jgi:putative endonuclease
MNKANPTTPYFVYLLLCSDGSFYTGSTNNPEQRFLDHKNGKGGAYTRSHKPVKLIYTEELPDKSSALKREYQIKSWPRQKKIVVLGLSLE